MGVIADLPRLLGALDGLERRMREQNSPVARHLRPGLNDREIDSRIHDLPFPFSDELRAFYGWHDGVLELDRPEWAYFPGGGVLRPLDLAVQDYRKSVGVPVFGGCGYYDPCWFPINSVDGISLVVDCGVAPGEASPIHYVDGKTDWQQDCAPSLLDVIEVWNFLLDERYISYNDETADWDMRYTDIPAHIRHADLISL